MKIKEIMEHIKDRELPCVSSDSDIGEVIRVAVRFPHTRLVYVVDEQGRLLGAITIGSLIRHLYPYHYNDKIHPRDILRNIHVEKAAHLMSSGNVNASPDETVDAVFKRMAGTGAKEMAVVDGNGRILADITAIDLLKYYEL
ncbi:MAG: CBS domain-containing protein [Proteobacteria bacterium]|nr:CBS domain-containing protein [Pseudomonadota bacterium]MBU1739346.1 CBS domain-containing protein [Pseudomonadota bacterium]